MSSKKRFIAGATCPQCKVQDRTVTYHSEGKDYRECIACGFSEARLFDSQPEELETRGNRQEPQRQSEIQVLQFTPNPSSSDDNP